MWAEILSILPATLVLSYAKCPNNAQCSDDAVSSQLASAINGFSWDLFKTQLQKQGNVVISPVSVSTLFAILQQGAGGNTLCQLNSVLSSTPDESKQGYCQLTRNLQESQDNQTLEYANGGFLQTGFNVLPNMQNILQNVFLTDIKSTNFSQPDTAAAEINSWASNHTHGLIPKIVEPDQVAGLTLVLLNAIYFKNQWKTSFNDTDTYNETFYKDGSEKVRVPMMHISHEFPTGTLKNVNARWLALPFKGGRFYMLFIVPDEIDGVDTVVASLTSQDLSEIIHNISNTAGQMVKLSLPKFKIGSTMDLVKPLKELGLIDILTGKSDLSGFSNETLSVSSVIQKAVLEVEEQGVTAAAVTGVGMGGGAPPQSPVVMKINRPSLAFIVDVLNEILLFACRVSDPASSN